jgi:DNA-binding MarR family transcriptional regulator
VTTAAVTGIIDRLVRCGYVLRKSDTSDRRIIYVEATQKGLTMTKKIMSQRRQLIMQIFSKISQDDRSRYLDILTRVKDLLVQERAVGKAHA